MTLLTNIYVWTADSGRSSAGRSLTVSLDAQRLAKFLILLAGCILGFRYFPAIFSGIGRSIHWDTTVER